MFETIDRTRSGISNTFWQGIKQLNGMPPETIIGNCARSTNVYAQHGCILWVLKKLVPNPRLFSRHKLYLNLYTVALSYPLVPCGSGAFSLEEGRIAPLPVPRHVVKADYLECLAMYKIISWSCLYITKFVLPKLCIYWISYFKVLWIIGETDIIIYFFTHHDVTVFICVFCYVPC